jgi:hypothetical protein
MPSRLVNIRCSHWPDREAGGLILDSNVASFIGSLRGFERSYASLQGFSGHHETMSCYVMRAFLELEEEKRSTTRAVRLTLNERHKLWLAPPNMHGPIHSRAAPAMSQLNANNDQEPGG